MTSYPPHISWFEHVSDALHVNSRPLVMLLLALSFVVMCFVVVSAAPSFLAIVNSRSIGGVASAELGWRNA